MAENTESIKPLEDQVVAIRVNGSTLTCNKHVLMKESDYFRAMFESSMIESHTNIVTLHDQDSDLMSALLTCMQTGELSISPQNIRSLTEAAVMLQVAGAIKTCSAYLINLLDDANCFQLNAFAESLALDNLYSTSKRHSLYYFKGVCATEEFLGLDASVVKDYLNEPHINCDSEQDIVDAIYRWYNEDPGVRLGELESLLECVRHDDLDKEEFRQLGQHHMITDTETASAWYKSAALAREQRSPGDASEKYRQVPMQFLTVGGIVESDSKAELCTTISKFDESKRDFLPFQSLKDIFTDYGPNMGFHVTVMGKDLYVTGGLPSLTRGKFNMDVWKFDSFLNTWKIVTQLPLPRRHHGTCASQTELFLMGGFGKYRCILDSMQKYDTLTGSWMDLPAIPRQCYVPLCSYMDGKIYLKAKKFTYSFNTHTNTWSELTWQPVTHPLVQFVPYKHNLYLFPFVEYDFEPLIGFNICKLDMEHKKSEQMQQLREFPLGNWVVMCNRKVYSVDRLGKQFVQGYMEENKPHKVLGDVDRTSCTSFLVALPNYPVYKVSDG